MARIKYDINIKPNPFVSFHWLVRFTNEEALNLFNHKNPEFKENVKAAHLNEWFPMTAETYEWMNYNSDFSSYTWNTAIL